MTRPGAGTAPSPRLIAATACSRRLWSLLMGDLPHLTARRNACRLQIQQSVSCGAARRFRPARSPGASNRWLGTQLFAKTKQLLRQWSHFLRLVCLRNVRQLRGQGLAGVLAEVDVTGGGDHYAVVLGH